MDDSSLPPSPSSTRTAFNCPPSPAYTTSTLSSAFTASTTSLPADSICIKAIYGTSIILLRVSRRIGLAEVRQLLYDKFTNQEGISLPARYNIVFVPHNPSSASSVTLVNGMDVQEITLESDWEEFMSTIQLNKITLRIQDISTT